VVELADVSIAIPEAIKTGGQYFAELWNDTENQHETILQILANQPASNQSAIKKLIFKEIIDKETLQFKVPMVRHYLEHREQD